MTNPVCGVPHPTAEGVACELRAGHAGSHRDFPTDATRPERWWSGPEVASWAETYDEAVTVAGAHPRKGSIDPPSDPLGAMLAVTANEYGAERVLTRAHEVLSSDPDVVAELRHQIETLEGRLDTQRWDRDAVVAETTQHLRSRVETLEEALRAAETQRGRDAERIARTQIDRDTARDAERKANADLATLRHDLMTAQQQVEQVVNDRDGLLRERNDGLSRERALAARLREVEERTEHADRLGNLLDLALHRLRLYSRPAADELEQAIRDTGDLPAPDGYVRESKLAVAVKLAEQRQEAIDHQAHEIGELGKRVAALTAERDELEAYAGSLVERGHRQRVTIRDQRAELRQWKRVARRIFRDGRAISPDALVALVRERLHRDPSPAEETGEETVAYCGAPNPDYRVHCNRPAGHDGDHCHDAGEQGVTWSDTDPGHMPGLGVRCGAVPQIVVAGAFVSCGLPEGHPEPHVAPEQPEVVWR